MSLLCSHEIKLVIYWLQVLNTKNNPFYLRKTWYLAVSVTIVWRTVDEIYMFVISLPIIWKVCIHCFKILCIIHNMPRTIYICKLIQIYTMYYKQNQEVVNGWLIKYHRTNLLNIGWSCIFNMSKIVCISCTCILMWALIERCWRNIA